MNADQPATTAAGSRPAAEPVYPPSVPQSLTLLQAGAVPLAPADRAALARIRYTPCLAGLFWVDRPPLLPEPGALQRPGNDFPWMVDNQRKGISPDATIITVHAGPDPSRRLYEADDAEAMALLTEGLQPCEPAASPPGLRRRRLRRTPGRRSGALGPRRRPGPGRCAVTCPLGCCEVFPPGDRQRRVDTMQDSALAGALEKEGRCVQASRYQTHKEEDMDTTATCTGHSTTGRRLYLALELSNSKWKLGFTVGMGQDPRQRTIDAGDTRALRQEIAQARQRFLLGLDSPGYSSGADRQGPLRIGLPSVP